MLLPAIFVDSTSTGGVFFMGFDEAVLSSVVLTSASDSRVVCRSRASSTGSATGSSVGFALTSGVLPWSIF